MTPYQITRHIDILGLPVRDKVSDYTGIATSICFDLDGGIKIWVTPDRQDLSNKEYLLGTWFDLRRLEITSDQRVMNLPHFAEYAYGPANKAPPRG